MILAATVTFWVLTFDQRPAYDGHQFTTKEACREYAIKLFEINWPALPRWWECSKVQTVSDPVSRRQEILTHELEYPYRYLCGPDHVQICTTDPIKQTIKRDDR